MSCTCPLPNESTTPNKAGVCQTCARLIPTDLRPQRAYVRALKDIPEVATSPDYEDFVRLCDERARRGQEEHGFRFLTLDNQAEVAEETADVPNYGEQDVIQARRLGREDCEDLIKMQAFHAFKIFELGRRIKAKRAGNP